MNGSPTDYSAAFRRCLETADVALMRKLWRHLQPNLPQPETDEATLTAIHMARTSAQSIDVKLRMYSHAWLVERGVPSLLPDDMRASAMRMYPRVARAVGISVNARSEWMRPATLPVRQAMENAVLEAFADNADDATVKRHMMEAKERTMRQLFGRVPHG
jgi:hypothetical protein